MLYQHRTAVSAAAEDCYRRGIAGWKVRGTSIEEILATHGVKTPGEFDILECALRWRTWEREASK
jgi:hypothetical protein